MVFGVVKKNFGELVGQLIGDSKEVNVVGVNVRGGELVQKFIGEVR